MYRIVKMSHKWYAIDVDLDDDTEAIEQFVSEGSCVILASSISEAEELLDEEIIVVDPE